MQTAAKQKDNPMNDDYRCLASIAKPRCSLKGGECQQCRGKGYRLIIDESRHVNARVAQTVETQLVAFACSKFQDGGAG